MSNTEVKKKIENVKIAQFSEVNINQKKSWDDENSDN